MAITKLNYIGTPKGGGAAHLKNAIAYIMNPDKTENDVWIGGNAGNTSGEVFQVMMDTKREWGKEGGRQGYHFVISFPPGEATAKQAYAVIRDFCEEYLGKNYDCVFAIHTDQAHMHGHIIFNSVNRMSGYKYRYEKRDWEKIIQPITDQICERYGLPPLTYEKKRRRKGKSYAEHYAEKEGRPTETRIIKADIDYFINRATSWDDFVEQMQMCGYEIRQKKYVTYKAPGYGNGRRDYRLGPGYTREDIIERIAHKDREMPKEPMLSQKLFRRYQTGLSQYLSASLSPYQAKKLRIFYQVGRYLEERNPFIMNRAEVRNHVIHIDQLYEECRYMLKSGIKSSGDLQKRAAEIKKEEAVLRNRRRTLESVNNEELLEEYQRLKKEMDSLPAWDDRFESLQEEISQIEEKMPEGFFSEYNKEKKLLEERLRAVRQEKRIVNRMLKEEQRKEKYEKKEKGVEQNPKR